MKLGDSGGVGVKLSPYNWRSDCIFQGFSRFIGKRASDLSLMLSFNVKERSEFQKSSTRKNQENSFLQLL